MTLQTQITILKESLLINVQFTKWIYHLKLRFRTRQWASSLDCNSYKIVRDIYGKAIGITMQFPFLINEDTFVQRMGEEAMALIDSWWFESQHEDSFTCPVSQGPPQETYWILIRDPNFGWDFDGWVDLVESYFCENRWEHNINRGHEIIRDADDEEVGIYVTIPYPMTFSTFFCRMNERIDAFTYVSKTTQDMPQYQLTECHQLGFFDSMVFVY